MEILAGSFIVRRVIPWMEHGEEEKNKSEKSLKCHCSKHSLGLSWRRFSWVEFHSWNFYLALSSLFIFGFVCFSRGMGFGAFQMHFGMNGKRLSLLSDYKPSIQRLLHLFSFHQSALSVHSCRSHKLDWNARSLGAAMAIVKHPEPCKMSDFMNENASFVWDDGSPPMRWFIKRDDDGPLHVTLVLLSSSPRGRL